MRPLRAAYSPTPVLAGSATGFTLIELSIVLVIIGLIVGGVLVGQDLVRAAAVRAQITQIEKFNQAANTFYGKYGALPGDLNARVASAFGFTPRGQYGGQGDGNGVIEGCAGNYSGCNYGFVEGAGETVMFWVDLSYANGLNVNLIEGSFSLGSPTTPPGSVISGTALSGYFPPARIGGGNYVYVYSQGGGANGSSFAVNYFSLAAMTGANTSANGCAACSTSNPGLTVRQAYDIDAKIDDGLPLTGGVLAKYGDSSANNVGGGAISPNAATASITTCFDTTSGNYSVTQSGGAGVNCALSFKMRAGD